MFQPETEDMLPRCAPKPSVPLDINTASIGRPTVPEVSILFDAQQTGSTSATTTTSTSIPSQQTYAAWKKQVLPKVSFPPAGAEVYSINGHVVGSTAVSAATQALHINDSTTTQSSLYPLRPVTANVSSPTTAGSTTSHSVNGVTTLMQQYRRSLEQPLCTVARPKENFQRRSLDACATLQQTYQSNRDVLTICAGTQTDTTLLSDLPKNDSALLAQLPTKEDFQQLLTIFQEMRTEQQRLVNAVESLLHQQQSQSPQQSVTRQDASTQCNYINCSGPKEDEAQIPPRQYEVIEEYNERTSANALNNRYRPIGEVPAYLLESPRQPAAQSTAYQAHTPRNTMPPTKNLVLSKPSSEKSMLMNELALKYLPNEQLNELFQELNIAATQKPTTPLRPVENIVKGPSDISNASYKYLKKYRLLPEGQDDVKEQLRPVCSPLAQATRQHQREQSPYSPRASTSQAPMLDLEHIRRQPKLI
ncbi:uncharacterized protein LOC129246366 isoform X1 [Anastrepha obliqua]|uniref:uncharacterized protein LOC129246366 isoform X1 n=1 Tax=Anastrepha obliqua TaxID=95512 RepID=UPI002408FDE5|nr:uncharacterized protein LOC129246366 isoform X1 [Anastrepha obliqua]